ncbi:hypothetical protein F5887DRAFT_46264 [Amanita rubescens]|nr:hypothetical protein F5887DRAFT_46264 [Amanita rubescens]
MHLKRETGTMLPACEHVSLQDQGKKSHKASFSYLYQKLLAKKRARPKQSLIAEFPPELLGQIITYFMRDFSTTFDQLKSLRLVCRAFNHAAAPRVLSSVRLFGNGDNPVSNIRQLHAMVSSNLNSNLYATNTLVLGWKWKYERLTVFKSFRKMRNSDQWVSGMIWNSTLAPLVYLLMILVVPRFLPLNICDSAVRLHARYRLPRALVLSMPNVSRVM